MSSKAIFLDRDGTINVDYGYLYRPSDLRFIDGAIEAMRMLCDEGYKIIIITNQSGIGRGYFTEAQYLEFSDELCTQLRDRGVTITETMMCPHAPEHKCSCRKPNPKMILEAMELYDITAEGSYMFGDKPSDVECGEAAGVTSRLITAEQNLLYWAKQVIERSI